MSGWINPTNWYWSIQDSSPGTQVWQSSSGSFVALANADYVAFLAAGNAATPIDTLANFLKDPLNAFNVSLWTAGNFLGSSTNVFPSGAPGTTITLSNPLKSFQICTGAPTSACNLVLPISDVFGSYPIGYPLFVENQFTTTAGIVVLAQDGVTAIGTVPTGTVGMFELGANSTQNGGWTPASLSLLFPGSQWRPNQGGTGLNGATVVAHSVPIVQAAGVTFHQVTPATAGQYLRDNGAGVDPSFAQPAFSELSGSASAAQMPAFTGDVTTSAGSTVTTLANIPNDAVMAGDVLATNSAAPSSPASGKTRIYVDSTSKNIAVKNDAGTVNHGVQTKAAVASNWIRSIADDGSSTQSQPAFTDISGTASLTTQVAGTLPVANGGTNYTGGAWPTYTATLVPDVGTITQGTNQSAYLQIGKIVMVNIHELISSVSGGPTQMGVTLPVACKRNISVWGIESSAPDSVGTFWAAGATVSLRIRNASSVSTQPLANKEIAFSLVYEAN